MSINSNYNFEYNHLSEKANNKLLLIDHFVTKKKGEKMKTTFRLL